MGRGEKKGSWSEVLNRRENNEATEKEEQENTESVEHGRKVWMGK